ncbi:hypothetical protein RE428_02930 [Marinobacter nanhaiticus D15-8W]|uniref:DUF4087 domain-containing protein n=2 Tax=Marinobacter TaxID=2742 RepID=N6WU15_9GAMM|nr:DUF4087 domain-containing protein [Marinobacter nanhaiticus D15-8W]BES69275.1 hypothetical protein RE428_02930 [Marinobacter nanhaiticus D15-8W]
MTRFTLLLSLLLFQGCAIAKETRCGWLDNPSPGNYWLSDKDGTWIIARQGAEQAEGVELLTPQRETDFVNMNYGYGYSCACIRVEANHDTQLIEKIYKYKQLSLEQCLDDDSIKKRNIRLRSPGERN